MKYRLNINAVLLLCSLMFSHQLFAQLKIDSTQVDKNKLQLKHADKLVLDSNRNENFYKLVGAVKMQQDDITMTCDSANFFIENNFLEAFGNVIFSRPNGNSAMADYVKYTGNIQQAVMKKNVQVIDDGKTLTTDDLVYNLRTKIGKYKYGGTLENGNTTVSSNVGTYDGKSSNSHFVGNVVITNPEYNIDSEELTYNTKTKMIRFLNQSTIVGENGTMETKKGFYNEQTGDAEFTSRTSIENNEQYVIGNFLKFNEKNGKGFGKGKVEVIDKKEGTTLTCEQVSFNRKLGYGNAQGNVVVIDTNNKSKLLAGQLQYNEFSKFSLATKNPKLISLIEKDSLFIAGDTMITCYEQDVNMLGLKTKNKIDKDASPFFLLHVEQAQELGREEKKIIITYQHVKIFSDSMQAIADSMSYSQADSVFRLYKNPILWSEKQQAIGDTIFLFTEKNKMKEMQLLQNAFLVNDTKYPKMYDQLKGKNITGFFVDGEINEVFVDQNAESLYYGKDDSEAYIGLNISKGASINAFFKNKEVKRILIKNDPEGKMIPMDKIQDADRFLPDYKWEEAKRPKSKKDVLGK
ncbi:MAG: LPS export ABC transporter periplasmic protein LptC [Chitinophagaceae bacterium]|nr:LPS export ABC transporter periplasmic protein LptC [Chitinophagaceae bacterium]